MSILAFLSQDMLSMSWISQRGRGRVPTIVTIVVSLSLCDNNMFANWFIARQLSVKLSVQYDSVHAADHAVGADKM